MKLIKSSTCWFVCVIIFTVFCILGNVISPFFCYLALGVCLVEIAICSHTDNFYFSIFLIANLRIFDETGFPFLINICMVLPLIKYVIFHRLRKDILCFALLFFLLELFHMAFFDAWDGFFPLVCWIMAFIYAFSCIFAAELNIDSAKSGLSLAIGVLCSALVYLVSNTNYTYNIISFTHSGYRLSGFAGDPNYYSLYLCLAMAMLLGAKRSSRWSLLCVVLLIGAGLLTASKMCFLMMNFIVGYAVVTQAIKKDYQGKRIRRVLLCVIVATSLLWKYVIEFFNNLLVRSGIDMGGDSAISMYQLTTGRSAIVNNYMSILGTNLFSMLLGAGMSYHYYLGIASQVVAHNTYLDIVLAWGVGGAILLMVVGIGLVRTYHKQHPTPFTLGRILPLLTVLLNFFDLSCFSATMFWFVLALALNGIYGCKGADIISVEDNRI